jgi:hypothetical protein
VIPESAIQHYIQTTFVVQRYSGIQPFTVSAKIQPTYLLSLFPSLAIPSFHENKTDYNTGPRIPGLQMRNWPHSSLWALLAR